MCISIGSGSNIQYRRHVVFPSGPERDCTGIFVDTLLSHTCKWREVHLKREAMCPGMSRLMIHGEDVTATAEGCSFCNLLQLAEKRAQSLHKRRASTQIHCDWTSNAPCLSASEKC